MLLRSYDVPRGLASAIIVKIVPRGMLLEQEGCKSSNGEKQSKPHICHIVAGHKTAYYTMIMLDVQ
eukprot:scaffold216588_cov47-Prasinocladus_malaysianus.AAC.1